jgi:uncharacterized protein YgbK (DUF1537 family)
MMVVPRSPARESADRTAASGLRLAFYGDDFTGSTDALEVLASAGWRCALFLQEPDARTLSRHPGLDAVGIAGDSRAMTPDEMQAQLPATLDWLASAGAPVLHYKVCSTFDSAPTIGSIGRVMKLARARLGGACLPIVAATPHLGRFCLYGHLFARAGTDGRVYRIDRHPIMRVHPVTPMDEADLTVHLGHQCDFPIAKASLEEVREGTASLLARLDAAKAEGAGAVLVDGLDATDMQRAGDLLLAIGRPAQPTFVVGGSGVEHALTSAWAGVPGAGRTPPDFTRQAVPQVLAISGSASALSASQIDRAIEASFAGIALDPVRLLDETQYASALDQAVHEAIEALARGASVILHTARGPQDPRIAAVRQSLQARGLDAEAQRLLTGRVLGERLGQLVRRILQAHPLQRLLLSGGDTSSAIARVLDVRAVEMAAALTPGAPLCRVLESDVVPGMEIAFKGGQMGRAEFFREARDGSTR